jgi:hypothetical protein
MSLVGIYESSIVTGYVGRIYMYISYLSYIVLSTVLSEPARGNVTKIRPPSSLLHVFFHVKIPTALPSLVIDGGDAKETTRRAQQHEGHTETGFSPYFDLRL